MLREKEPFARKSATRMLGARSETAPPAGSAVGTGFVLSSLGHPR
jgi:hypothetical protein